MGFRKVTKLRSLGRIWGNSIYYGIKTGYNPAFIVDTPTKERIVAEDPRSAEILRPILRGRDIGRYRAEWAKYDGMVKEAFQSIMRAFRTSSRVGPPASLPTPHEPQGYLEGRATIGILQDLSTISARTKQANQGKRLAFATPCILASEWLAKAKA